MSSFYPAKTQQGMPQYIGKQTLEETSVEEHIQWLTCSIEMSNGLEPEFTSTQVIRRLCCLLDTELRKRGEF